MPEVEEGRSGLLARRVAGEAARRLNDEEFAAALKFVRASFEAALTFRAESDKTGKAVNAVQADNAVKGATAS